MKNESKNSMEISLGLLIDSIARCTQNGNQDPTEIPALSLFRMSEQTGPVSVMYEPSICIAVQGAKRVYLGEETYVYDAHNYLITSVHLPTRAQVIEASPEKPFMALRLKLDLKEVSQLMLDGRLPPPSTKHSSRGMATGEITLPLLNTFQRLIALLDDEQDIQLLAAIMQREIIYRLLVGDQGERLRQLATAGSKSQQIGRAIEWLTSNFAQPLSIDDLAGHVNMSTTSFHNHFRSMTSLSPLQFQKQMRLQEARRLMLSERMDAANAAFQVGYESPSQFSREYNRLFGAPPLRDITNLRQMATGGRA